MIIFINVYWLVLYTIKNKNKNKNKLIKKKKTEKQNKGIAWTIINYKSNALTLCTDIT